MVDIEDIVLRIAKEHGIELAQEIRPYLEELKEAATAELADHAKSKDRSDAEAEINNLQNLRLSCESLVREVKAMPVTLISLPKHVSRINEAQEKADSYAKRKRKLSEPSDLGYECYVNAVITNMKERTNNPKVFYHPNTHALKGNIEPQVLEKMLEAIIAYADEKAYAKNINISVDYEQLSEQKIVGQSGLLPGRYVKVMINENGTASRLEFGDRFPFDTREIGPQENRQAHLNADVSRAAINLYRIGGALDIRPNKDKGTTFELYIPSVEIGSKA